MLGARKREFPVRETHAQVLVLIIRGKESQLFIPMTLTENFMSVPPGTIARDQFKRCRKNCRNKILYHTH